MVNMNEDFGAYKDSIWKGLTARELGVMAVSAVSCGIIIILLYFILGWNLYIFDWNCCCCSYHFQSGMEVT